MKKIIIIILAFTLMSSLYGCTTDIPTTTSFGMSRIMSSTEMYAMEMLLKDNQEITKLINPISWDYSNDITTVRLMVELDDIDLKDIKKGSLKGILIDDNIVIDTFIIGDKSNLVKTYDNENNMATISYESDDSTECAQTIQISYGAFRYINNDIMSKKYVDSEDENISDLNNIKMTKEEAVDAVVNYINELHDVEIEIVDIRLLYSDVSKEEFYRIDFVPQIGETLFENSNVSSPYMVKLSGSATIRDTGLGLISANFMFSTQANENIDKILNLDNVLQILPIYIDKYYAFTDYIQIEGIQLKYVVKLDETNQLLFYPVWIFLVDTENSNINSNWQNDIMINAITGQLEALY